MSPVFIAAFCLLSGLAAVPARAESATSNSVRDAFFAPLAPADETNRLAIVGSGYDALMLRVFLIRNARESIDIQTFIWTNDEVGSLIMYELIESAKRGVRVRIIADHMVSERDPGTAAFLATVHTNLEIRHYRPPLKRLNPGLLETAWAGLTGFNALNQRMHNKLMVFDGRVLITGGRNIENTYYDHSTEMNFRDRDVVAAGPVAKEASGSFQEFWDYRHTARSADLTDVAHAIATGSYKKLQTREEYGFGVYFKDLDREADTPAEIQRRFIDRLKPVRKVTFISDEPGKKRGLPLSEQARITRTLARAIDQAEQSIVMQTPYLVLSKPARKLFREVQKKHPGLRIRISSNSFASTDNIMAYSANYRLRGIYVEDLGLEVHEFKPQPKELDQLFPQYGWMKSLAAERIESGKQSREPFMCIHAKSLVVDDRVAFVGSYNLDPRSENLNTEVGLLVVDEAFASDLRAEIERDMRAENSWVIARRRMPLRLDVVNGLIDSVLSLSPLDIWPIQNTCSFELKPGEAEVPPGDPKFYDSYREAGSFPGSDGLLSQKEITTRIYKAVGSPLTPIL